MQVAERLAVIAAMPPPARGDALAQVHERVASAQVASVSCKTTEEASRVLCDGSTVGQVVGHVTAWERFVLLAFGELLTGVRSPRILRTAGWIGDDGEQIDFANGDQFSAYILQRDARRDWADLQACSVQTARRLHRLLAWMVTSARDVLDDGSSHVWHVRGASLPPMPAGWYLWISVLWHTSVEHGVDLGLTHLTW